MLTEEQEQAIVSAESAVQNNPTDFGHYNELGWAYFHAERLNEAMAAFQRAVALNPNSAGALNGIGRVYERLGPPQAALAAYEQAIASLQQAIRLQPDDTFAYGNLSILYLHQKQYDDMIVTCESGLKLVDDPSTRRLLGIAYDRLGRHQEAIQQLEQSITRNPQDYEARGLLAKILRTVGRQPEADAHYAIASEMAEQDNEYGQACFAAVSGNLDEALRLLEVASIKKQVQPGWARIDPELANLADDPRFKAWIEQ